MILSISSEWLDFLEKLSKKPENKPLCFYQQDLDFLYVICGNGGCSDWNRLWMGKMIFSGVDVIEKMHPEDFEPDGDTFAGLEIWGGVQDFLSHNYQMILRENYESFRVEHNSSLWTTPIAEIINFLEKDKRGLVKPRWLDWQDRVSRAFREQKPEVHIPLLPVSVTE